MKTAVNVGELEVLVRPVPPTATVHWQKAHLDIPEKPSRPMAEMTSPLDGHTEAAPALPDSEEWNAWLEKMQVWHDDVEQIQDEHKHEQLEYHLDYAVVGWREADSGAEWQEYPPESWEPPDVLRRHGVPVPEDKRLAYLMYVVLDEPWKVQAVSDHAWPSDRDAERDTSPITEGEVAAVMDKFRSRDEDSRRDVGTIAGVSGERVQDERIRTRDAESGRDAHGSGLLAKIVSWF